MAFNPLAGKSGSVKVGEVDYAFGKWAAAMKNNLGEVPNFTGGGYMQRVPGMTDGDVNVEGPYDQGNMAFTAGNAYTLILGYTGEVNLTIPTLCETINPEVDVTRPQTVKLGFKANGAFSASIA